MKSGDERLDEIIPPPPTRAGLELVLSLAETRCQRAQKKLDLAAGEIVDAKADCERAKAALDKWIADNPEPQPEPDPQIELF